MVAAGIRRHVLRQPAEEPGLLLGVRQPLHVRPGLRVPGHLPGLLPAGQDRHRQGRCAAADIPGHPHPVRRPHRRVPPRRETLGPDRPAEDLRPHRVGRVRPGVVRDRRRQQLQRFPGRHGHQRTRLRRVRGRRPRARGRRAARQAHRGQGSRRVQHRRRASLFPSRRRSRRPSWRSATEAAATACCIWSPDSAPSSEPPPSCRCGGSDEHGTAGPFEGPAVSSCRVRPRRPGKRAACWPHLLRR